MCLSCNRYIINFTHCSTENIVFAVGIGDCDNCGDSPLPAGMSFGRFFHAVCVLVYDFGVLVGKL
jgi:hypothetical protein